MKKLIIKTALITFSVALVVGVSVFGIISFAAPAIMMRFCDSLGMDEMSADYAYQNYQLKGDIDSLARSFEIAAATNNDTVAAVRFDELYGEDDSEQRRAFTTYCEQQDVQQDESIEEISVPEEVAVYSYRSVVCAKAAVVRYHLAQTDEERTEVCLFAARESEEELSAESPICVLAADCVSREDAEFGAILRDTIVQNAKFNKENEIYLQIIKSLEELT